MNSSSYSLDYLNYTNIASTVEPSSKVSSHYGCSNCARVLCEGEIIEHFETPLGMNNVLRCLNQNCNPSEIHKNNTILHNLILSMICPNCGKQIEGIELLVSGFLNNYPKLGDDQIPLGVHFISCAIHGVVENSNQPLAFMGISFGTLNSRILRVQGKIQKH